MATQPKTIHVEAGGEIARLLDDATAMPVLLERDGVRYRLAVEEKEDIWADYDPDKVREVIDQTAGSLSDAEADTLVAAIYKAREEGSRPADRP